MKQTDYEKFLNEFPASEKRFDEARNINIFEIDFDKLYNFWTDKNLEELGEFESQTAKNILENSHESGDKAIFAIIHEDNRPLKIEMKTGKILAKTLREAHESVVPSKLMNEREWNLIIGNNQLDDEEIKDLLRLSYRLVSENI